MFGENQAKQNDSLMDEKIQKWKKHTFKQKLYPNYRRYHKKQEKIRHKLEKQKMKVWRELNELFLKRNF